MRYPFFTEFFFQLFDPVQQLRDFRSPVHRNHLYNVRLKFETGLRAPADRRFCPAHKFLESEEVRNREPFGFSRVTLPVEIGGLDKLS